MEHRVTRLRQMTSSDLGPDEVRAIRAILDEAFGTGEDAFAEDDWTHALGGRHFVLDVGGRIATHASVVPRTIHIGDRPVRTGYVEAVATSPQHQGQRLGTMVMTAVGAYLREAFELGALGTGRHHFYERLGWERWAGPAFVRAPEGPRRTPDEEGFILVLRTPTSPRFDLTEAISCEPRVGDDW